VIRSRCEVLSSRKNGAYHLINLVAPEIAEKARAGQFIEVAMPAGRDAFLRRPFFVHETSRRGGWAGTLEFVVEPGGPETRWLADIKAHQFLDVIGPLGRPFGYPKRRVGCMLVSEGYGAAPLYFLAEELRAQGHRVDMIVGASTQDLVLKPIEAKRLSRTIAVVTEDGSIGDKGHVMDVLPSVIGRARSQVVYAAGPRPMLRGVAEYCRSNKIPAQVAVEERMACGLGLCWSCVVPVARRYGRGFEHVRACVEGPAINAQRILWDRWGDVGSLAATPPEGFPIVEGMPELIERPSGV
jgi:dihydroorotate dehydrogenase electron transfer subunit